MIIKIKKRENPYVQIDHRILEDARLSWRAKGVLAYLLSKPPEWEVRSEDVINKSTDGRDAVRSAMAELKELGYAELINTRDGRRWVVREEPSPEKPFMAMPSPEKPRMALANMAETPPSNKEEIVSKKEGSNKELLTLEAPPESKPPKRFSPPNPQQVETYFREIGMNSASNAQATKFCDHYGMAGWILNNGRKMADWKCAARLWKSRWEKWTPEEAKTANLQSPDKTAEMDQAFRTFLEGHENTRLRTLFISKPYRSLSSIDLSSVSGEFGRWRRTGKYDSQGVAA